MRRMQIAVTNIYTVADVGRLYTDLFGTDSPLTDSYVDPHGHLSLRGLGVRLLSGDAPFGGFADRAEGVFVINIASWTAEHWNAFERYRKRHPEKIRTGLSAQALRRRICAEDTAAFADGKITVLRR